MSNEMIQLLHKLSESNLVLARGIVGIGRDGSEFQRRAEVLANCAKQLEAYNDAIRRGSKSREIHLLAGVDVDAHATHAPNLR